MLEMRNTDNRSVIWKGVGYIFTGLALILMAFTFSGLALSYLDTFPGVNPSAPVAVFLVTLLTGIIWGSVFIWKGGFMILPSRRKPTSQKEYKGL